jgi:Domain of unknown function (DUF222)
MCTGAVGEGVGQVRAGLAVVNAADVTALSDEQVRSEVLELLACLNQLTGALLSRVGAFDLRDLSQVDAQRASSTWLVDFGRMSKGAALRWLATARQLAKLPALAEGVRAGTVSMEQLARVGELVRHIGIDHVREYDQILAQLCGSAGPVEVGRACERIWAMLDPDGAEPDPEEDFHRRELTFSQLGAMLYIRGRLDPEGAAAVQTAVDALMRPPAPGDQRSAAQRRADAMVDLARGALANGELPEVGGERPQVGILITPEILFGTPNNNPKPNPGECPQQTATPSADHQDPLTAAGVPPLPERPWLHWVGEVSPQLAQRLACDGTIWRLVLDPRTGLPLNVGRKIRIVPWWMRKAIRARDRTCRFPGCDVPSAWTDAHHLTAWWKGGLTAVEEIISLCRYHHGLVHEGEWTLRIDHTTGDVRARRPDGSPYELGPSRPWTSPNHQGPRPEAPPARAHPPNTADPPWPRAA